MTNLIAKLTKEITKIEAAIDNERNEASKSTVISKRSTRIILELNTIAARKEAQISELKK